MNNSNSKKNKHLSFDDRSSIQECLNFGMTFKSIAARIDKDQTTISKEVKKHLTVNESSSRRIDRDGNPLPPSPCPSLLKAPFVCNPCKRKTHTVLMISSFTMRREPMRSMRICFLTLVRESLLTRRPSTKSIELLLPASSPGNTSITS